MMLSLQVAQEKLSVLKKVLTTLEGEHRRGFGETGKITKFWCELGEITEHFFWWREIVPLIQG